MGEYRSNLGNSRQTDALYLLDSRGGRRLLVRPLRPDDPKAVLWPGSPLNAGYPNESRHAGPPYLEYP
jgi:hypothetical protein